MVVAGLIRIESFGENEKCSENATLSVLFYISTFVRHTLQQIGERKTAGVFEESCKFQQNAKLNNLLKLIFDTVVLVFKFKLW